MDRAKAAGRPLSCPSGGSTGSKAGAATATPTIAKDDSKPAMKADDTPSSKAARDETGNLPDMVGKGLQSAQDQSQEAGFYRLTSHDALGRDRIQALDRNWKVCSQTPKPGSCSTSAKVDFGAVKLDEDCRPKMWWSSRNPGLRCPTSLAGL
ncbi:hypothetical protein ACWGH4_12175 [Streptomyces sp. NPDC054847]